MSADIAVDTSALVALAVREPDAEWFVQQLVDAEGRYVSAGTVQEFFVVLASLHQQSGATPRSSRDYAMQILASLNLVVEPVTAALALLGSAGIMRYRVAPAKLNFGDGFAYGLAKSHGIPLLCNGNDFPHTDLITRSPT